MLTINVTINVLLCWTFHQKKKQILYHNQSPQVLLSKYFSHCYLIGFQFIYYLLFLFINFIDLFPLKKVRIVPKRQEFDLRIK